MTATLLILQTDHVDSGSNFTIAKPVQNCAGGLTSLILKLIWWIDYDKAASVQPIGSVASRKRISTATMLRITG